MSQSKWERRDAKVARRAKGMRVSGRSVFTLQRVIDHKAALKRREVAA